LKKLNLKKSFLMKYFIAVFTILLIHLHISAQQMVKVGLEEYQNLKKAGKLNDPSIKIVAENTRKVSPKVYKSEDIKRRKNEGIEKDGDNPCDCWIEPDDTYSTLEICDDDCSDAVNLPFEFCLYGDVYSNAYINNNGNITFDTEFIGFTSEGFPTNAVVMVAPFWADVDTRGDDGLGLNGGLVRYKITETSLIVNWVDVGYYSQYTDKKCSFQLIITNGEDPLITEGKNTSFCYKDMQWTTGDASSGVDGFGGTPATVGSNKGNGTDYVQFGRFDHEGVDFDGPETLSANDGVSFLDNQNFVFSSCAGNDTNNTTNIAPFIAGVNVCDTITICADGFYELELNFFAPEPDQTLVGSIVASQIPNYAITENADGTFKVEFYPTFADVGFKEVTVQVTDNGEPPLTETSTFFFNIIGVVLPELEITGNQYICNGAATTLTASDGFDVYEWSTGSAAQSITVTDPIGYAIIGYIDACSVKTDSFYVYNSLASPLINGNLYVCDESGTNLSTPNNYVSYEWLNSIPSIVSTDTLVNIPSGTYTLNVTDTVGCVGTNTVFVDSVIVATDILTNVCGLEATFQGTIVPDGVGTWNAFPSGTFENDTIAITTFTSSNYENTLITYTDRRCPNIVDSSYIFFRKQPSVSLSIPDICPGDTLLIYATVDGDFTNSFAWNFDGSSQGSSSPVLAIDPSLFVAIADTITIQADVQSLYCPSAFVTEEYTLVPCEFEIPNVFTPNGDLYNQTFNVPYLEYIEGNTLRIWNRWGSLVYEKESYKNDWDGNDLSDGVYFYEVLIPYIKNPYKGSVTIIK
jgi:gliding motility-associated-like protein